MTIARSHGADGCIAHRVAAEIRNGYVPLIAGERSGGRPVTVQDFILGLDGPPEQGPFQVTVSDLGGTWREPAVFESGIWRAEVAFDDGSTLNWDFNPDEDLEREHRAPVDTGPPLLESITQAEFEAMERILHLLWDAAAHDRLDAAQANKIRSIAEMISDERRDSVPGETERYGLVTMVRRGIRTFMTGDDILKNALAWSQLIEILTRIDWHTLASAARVAGS